MGPSHLCVPCTKSNDVRCNLLKDREAINQVLLGAGLELCEDVRQAGGIRLAVTQISACAYPLWAEQDDPVKSAAFKFANDLLARHRCFTALEVYSAAYCTRQVRDALKRSRSLKSLVVYLLNHNSSQDGNRADVFSLIGSLESLEELVFKTEIDPFYSTVQGVDGELLARALRHLTTLDVRDLEMSSENANLFVSALIANHTVVNLAVGGCIYRAGPGDKPGELFARFLTKSATTLKKLTMNDGPTCDNRVLWKTLIPALRGMTTLEELSLDLSIGYEIFTEVTALIGEVVLRCATLRLLQLPCTAQTYRGQFLNWYRSPQSHVAQWIESWVTTIRTTSKLQQLRIYLPGMDEVQCRALLQAVADNKTLKKVVLQEVPLIVNTKGSSNLMVLSSTIQELGLGDRVFLMNLSVTFQNAPKILASAELCKVNFKVLSVEFRAQRRMGSIKACLEALSRRGTSTSIKVCCDLMSKPAFGTLMDWLAKSSTLTHVEIIANDHAGIMGFCGYCSDLYDSVVSALAKNADIASELMRRNAARVSAAAKFVLGEDTRKGARVVESLHNHPRLLELVQEGARVTEAEAQEMARTALKRLRECSLDDYMRLTGVVKEKVERLDPDSKDGHLANLPAEIWLYVRQYLKITHVVNPARCRSLCLAQGARASPGI
ncbi:hypothetical protein HPB49_019813 [Dermacentor silvarum]|uniref:Uncharacterized protein n=1 Tax=Dermacentor silvarum TaxID=543639 RepID=A0ACB8CSY9_DERSI|nr:hypothetical protein HPB49_019813 [Dermacentor silvarum]